MKSDRLIFRFETRELLEKLPGLSKPSQLAYFGFQDETLLEKELIKAERRLLKQSQDSQKWYLIEKSSGTVIGSCGFHNWIPEHKRAELGYVLHEPFRNKGFMSEALGPVIQYGFLEMDLNRIEAFCSPDNAASIKLLRKSGFFQEGLLREHYHDETRVYDSMVFSLLKREHERINLPK